MTIILPLGSILIILGILLIAVIVGGVSLVNYIFVWLGQHSTALLIITTAILLLWNIIAVWFLFSESKNKIKSAFFSFVHFLSSLPVFLMLLLYYLPFLYYETSMFSRIAGGILTPIIAFALYILFICSFTIETRIIQIIASIAALILQWYVFYRFYSDTAVCTWIFDILGIKAPFFDLFHAWQAVV